MTAVTHQTSKARHRVVVALTEAQNRWLRESAAEQSPPQASDEFLRTLIDVAMEDAEAAEKLRARQFEIYRASGYSEHHPDYPTFRGGL